MARSRVTIECTCGSTNFDMPKEPKPNDMIRCTQCGEEGIFGDVLSQALAAVGARMQAGSADQGAGSEPSQA